MSSTIVDKLKREYKDLFILDKDTDDILEVISTGSPSLDVSTGIGGSKA